MPRHRRSQRDISTPLHAFAHSMSRHWHWAGPLAPTTLMACFPAQGSCSCGTRAIADPRSPHAHTHRVGLELVRSPGATSNTSSVHTLTHSHPHMHMPCRAHAHAPAPAQVVHMHLHMHLRPARVHTATQQQRALPSSGRTSPMSSSAEPKPSSARPRARCRPDAPADSGRCVEATATAAAAAVCQGGSALTTSAQPPNQP